MYTPLLYEEEDTHLPREDLRLIENYVSLIDNTVRHLNYILNQLSFLPALDVVTPLNYRY